MRRIDDAFETCPTRQLDASHLSPANLIESERHIYFRILASEKSQLADIIVLMLALSVVVDSVYYIVSAITDAMFIAVAVVAAWPLAKQLIKE